MASLLKRKRSRINVNGYRNHCLEFACDIFCVESNDMFSSVETGYFISFTEILYCD